MTAAAIYGSAVSPSTATSHARAWDSERRRGHHDRRHGALPEPPALFGADFFKEFNTDQKIIAVIRSGSVIGQAPIVSMPHWGGIIPDEQLRALVAYIKTLKTG